MRIYIYIYICMYVCMYVCMCIYIYRYAMCIYIYMHKCLNIRISILTVVITYSYHQGSGIHATTRG